MGDRWRVFSQNAPTQCTKLQLVTSDIATREDLPFDVTVKKADGGEIEGASVKWTISSGKIIEGDGTPHVVLAPKLPEDEFSSDFVVTATVMNLANACNTFLKDTYRVYVIFDPETWGKLSRFELQARMDNIYIQLKNDPLYEAVLIVHFAENAPRTQRVSYLKSIYSSIRFRHYDPSRLSVFVAEDDSIEHTMVLLTENMKKLAPSLVDPAKVIKANDIPMKVNSMFPPKK